MAILRKFWKKNGGEPSLPAGFTPIRTVENLFPNKDRFHGLADVKYADLCRKGLKDLDIINIVGAFALLDEIERESIREQEGWKEKRKEYLRLQPSPAEKRFDCLIGQALALSPFFNAVFFLLYCCFSLYVRKKRIDRLLNITANFFKKFRNIAFALVIPVEESQLPQKPVEKTREEKKAIILDWIIQVENKNINYAEMSPDAARSLKRKWQKMTEEVLETYVALQTYPEWKKYFDFFLCKLLENAMAPTEEKKKWPRLVATLKAFGVFLFGTGA